MSIEKFHIKLPPRDQIKSISEEDQKEMDEWAVLDVPPTVEELLEVIKEEYPDLEITDEVLEAIKVDVENWTP